MESGEDIDPSKEEERDEVIVGDEWEVDMDNIVNNEYRSISCKVIEQIIDDDGTILHCRTKEGRVAEICLVSEDPQGERIRIDDNVNREKDELVSKASNNEGNLAGTIDCLSQNQLL